MKCFHPKTIAHPSYPGEGEYITVPCRKCAACVQNRVNDWANRLITEAREPGFHYFVTLTYAVEPPTYQKDHIKLFIKNLRKHEKTIRYFVTGERGEKKDRVHYHAVIFSRNLLPDCIVQSWPFGFSSVDKITPGRCGYAAKYCCPIPGDSEYFLYVSRQPALGYKFTPSRTEYFERTGSTVYHEFGTIKPLPRYNRRKLKERGVIFKPDPTMVYRDYQRAIDYYQEHAVRDLKGDTYKQQQEQLFSERVFSRKFRK